MAILISYSTSASGIVVLSKETYGQTRNLELKRVFELAIIGVLLKAVKTSWVGRTYLTRRRLFSLAFVAHILQTHTSKIARVAKLQLNMEW